MLGDTLNAFSLDMETPNEPQDDADAFSVDNFTLTVPGQTLFSNASFKITQKHRYGILGPNGRGKTTLLRHIAARGFPVPRLWDTILVEQEAKASSRTAVEEVLAADETTVSLLSQEQELSAKLEQAGKRMEDGDETVTAEFLSHTQQELSRVSAELEASGADSCPAKVRKILSGLGFSAAAPQENDFSMDKPVEEFSGGWRMRISLAKALFLQPKLLMLDEPTNHLDLDAVLWLDRYLSETYPHTVIAVSHDADFLDKICTDIFHLENKKLVHYRGNYTSFKEMHNQKREVFAKQYTLQQKRLKELKMKGKTKDQAMDIVKSEFKKWARSCKFEIDNMDDLMEKPKDYIVKFDFKGHGMDQSIGGVNVSEVAFSYNGKKPWLLEECEIGIDCASRIAIVGPNGAGKTTLLKIMMGELEPCEGDVQHATGLRVKNYHQHFADLLPYDKDPVTHLQDTYNLSPAEKARSVLGQFGLPSSSHYTKIEALSGGQKARVAFSALTLEDPHIIVLDEPTNHLDIESVDALCSAVEKYKGGVVVVSHNARLIQRMGCALWVVEDNTVYEFEQDFNGYRNRILGQLDERAAAVERQEAKRRDERAKRRAALVPGEVKQLEQNRQVEAPEGAGGADRTEGAALAAEEAEGPPEGEGAEGSFIGNLSCACGHDLAACGACGKGYAQVPQEVAKRQFQETRDKSEKDRKDDKAAAAEAKQDVGKKDKEKCKKASRTLEDVINKGKKKYSARMK